MDYHLVISLLGLIVGVVGTHYARQQVVLIRNQMPASVNADPQQFLRLKLYGPIVVLMGLVLLAWVPYLWDHPKNCAHPLVMWGEVPHVEGKPYQFRVVVDGSSLKSYQATHSLAVICLQYDGTKDFLDVTGLQKSALYDIRNTPIDIVFDADESFVAELKKGFRGTRYILVRVPKGVTMDQFLTFRQAYAAGVVEVQAAVGPP